MDENTSLGLDSNRAVNFSKTNFEPSGEYDGAKKPDTLVLTEAMLGQLLSRWQIARTRALKQALVTGFTDILQEVHFPESTQERDLWSFLQNQTEILEEEVRIKLFDLVFKNVFDYSRKLAQSFSKFYSVSFEIEDFKNLISHGDMASHAPCFGSARISWKPSSLSLERGVCVAKQNLGSWFCDYWREAMDGLVMGLGDLERFARHQSAGHGDPQCLDVFYMEGRYSAHSQYGMIPVEIDQALDLLVEKFGSQKIKVEFLGINEGILFYLMENKQTKSGSLKSESPEFSKNTDYKVVQNEDSKPLCQSKGRFWHETLVKEVQKKFPYLRLKDVSPLAVYGSGT